MIAKRYVLPCIGFAWMCRIPLVVASLGYPSVGEICERAKDGGQPHCTTHHFLVAVFYNAWLWVEKFHDVLLVLGGFALAVVVIFQIAESRKSSERQLRAYIMVNGKDIDPRPGRFISKLKIINTGQTPAHNVKVLSATRVLLHPVSEDFDFSINDPGNPSVSILGPRMDVSQDSILDREEARREEFEEAIADNGWLRIYTYGVVTYMDIFNKPQWTNFCFYLQFSDRDGQGIASEHHNDAS